MKRRSPRRRQFLCPLQGQIGVVRACNQNAGEGEWLHGYGTELSIQRILLPPTGIDIRRRCQQSADHLRGRKCGRPMRQYDVSQGMSHDDNRKIRSLHMPVKSIDPLIARSSVPIRLCYPLDLRISGFPIGLPVIRTGIASTWERDDTYLLHSNSLQGTYLGSRQNTFI